MFNQITKHKKKWHFNCEPKATKCHFITIPTIKNKKYNKKKKKHAVKFIYGKISFIYKKHYICIKNKLKINRYEP